MKVLLHIDSLGSGGAQRQLCLLARGIRSSGWKVAVAIYHPQLDHFAPQLRAAQVPIVVLPKRHRFSPTVPLHLAWEICRGGWDCIVAFLPTPSVYALLAGALAGRPVIVSERIGFAAGGPSLLERAIAELQRLATAVVCNSWHHAEAFRAHFPWLAARTTVIFNGADSAPAARSVRRAGDGYLLAVGTITPRKNFACLIEALGVLQARGRAVPSVKWAGKLGHTSEDAAARAQADARLAELGLTGRWEWLGERRDMPELLAGATALVHAAVREGFPNAIGEALSAGVPVLASNCGDHPRLVTPGTNGFLFDPRRPADLADRLEEFHALPAAQREELGRAAAAQAVSELSLARMVDCYLHLLTAATARPALV